MINMIGAVAGLLGTGWFLAHDQPGMTIICGLLGFTNLVIYARDK